MKLFKFAIAGLLAGVISSHAAAQYSETCEYVLSQYSSYLSYYPESAQSIRDAHPSCFGGSAGESTQQINATSFSQAAAISRAISNRFNPTDGGPVASNDAKGMAAGGQPQSWNVWGSIEENDTDVSYYVPLVVNKHKGGTDIRNTVIGADYALSPVMVVGFSAAFDRGDGWGQNVGAIPGPKLDNSTDGYLLAPYLGYQISKELALDVSAGLGSGDFSTDTTKADVDRWFAAANLSYNQWIGNVQLTGKFSYLHGDEDYSNAKVKATGLKVANTGSENKIDQIRLGAQAGYWVNGIMPYAGLGYTSNVSRSSDAGNDPLGRDTFVATLGVNFYSLSSKVSGGIFYEEELNRSHSDNQLISANINFRF